MPDCKPRRSVWPKPPVCTMRCAPWPRGAPWRWIAPNLWPAPLSVVPDAVRGKLPAVAIGCGGKAAAVIAALRQRGVCGGAGAASADGPAPLRPVVVNRHDGSDRPERRGHPHRAASGDARRGWPRRPTPGAARSPLCRGRWSRCWSAVPTAATGWTIRSARRLRTSSPTMMRRDHVGLMLTPSRRTDPAVVQALCATGWGRWAPGSGTAQGENPYFGMLALADVIVVTEDSVSMVSEAVATAAPVLLAALPGRSRRIDVFHRALLDEGRVRRFAGRCEVWPTAPLNDTPLAAAELRRRLRL